MVRTMKRSRWGDDRLGFDGFLNLGLLVWCCTLCVPCRLSDVLLAKILNLSTHASRSSFTPTTVSQDQDWERKCRKKFSITFSNKDKCHIWRLLPAGLSSLPPILTSTAELTRMPMVPFSTPIESSAAVQNKIKILTWTRNLNFVIKHGRIDKVNRSVTVRCIDLQFFDKRGKD